MTRRPLLPVLLSTVAGGTALVGCSVRQVPPADAAAADPSVPASTSPASAPSTPLSTTMTAAAAGAATTPGPTDLDDVAPAPVIDGGPRGLATGAKGPAVAALEERLTTLRFNPGKADAAYDSRLALAVMAFQKQQDLPRTGRADRATLAKLAVAPLGAPMVATAEGTRVEIDLKRQIGQFWLDGRLLRVLAVSTGSGQRYCVPKDKGGGCDTAITPGGSYRADR
ncbi:MAG: peptidoglycan-binding domain-containing protein, partial [Acidimicrobiales bacterium]